VRDRLSELPVYQYADVPRATPAEPVEEGKLLDKAVDLRLAVLSASSRTPEQDIAKGTGDERIFYIYTSGTTGLPKAAVINNIRSVGSVGSQERVKFSTLLRIWITNSVLRPGWSPLRMRRGKLKACQKHSVTLTRGDWLSVLYGDNFCKSLNILALKSFKSVVITCAEIF